MYFHLQLASKPREPLVSFFSLSYKFLIFIAIEKLSSKIAYAKEVQKELFNQFAAASDEFTNTQDMVQVKYDSVE